MFPSSRFALLALAASGVGNGGLAMRPLPVSHLVRSSKTAMTETKTPLGTAIAVRGGACPIANDAAKGATGLLAVNAFYQYLAPTKALDMWGLPSTPKMEFLMDLCSSTAVAVALMAWCLIVMGTSATFAAGVGVIPVAVGSLKAILNERPKELGMPSAPIIVWLVISATSSYLLINDAPSGSVIMKLLTAWLLVNGIPLAIAPSRAGKMYGFFKEESDDPHVSTSIKALGYHFLTHACFVGPLVLGLDATKSFGFALVPQLIQVIHRLASGEVEELGISKGPLYFWLFLLTIFVGTMVP